MKKPPYQPPPNNAARFANNINAYNYDPGAVGKGPKYKDPVKVPKAKAKPPKANGDRNQWLFTEHAKVQKRKTLKKAWESVIRHQRELRRQKLDERAFERELCMIDWDAAIDSIKV